ncbi:MAG: hypothetical protein JWN70_543 [Planctomycetaceae bacterium]|nr:hypothetical protein [Planctomycetaceae bacterium]
MELTHPNNESRRTTILAIVRLMLGAILGWAIWRASPFMTGEVEPWDAFSPYYSISLVAAGLVSTFCRRAGQAGIGDPLACMRARLPISGLHIIRLGQSFRRHSRSPSVARYSP